MQLQIKPGLRRAWRGPQTVQIGLDTSHGTVVDGLTGSDRKLLERLTVGVNDRQASRSTPPEAGEDRALELVRLLSDAGVLIRSRAGRAALSQLGQQRDRLAADADVWSVVHDGTGDAWELLAARSRRHVRVIGAGRTGTSLATMLAAAGVGTVTVQDRAPVRPQDVAPAGAGIDDVGHPRETAARQALSRLGYLERRGPTAPGRGRAPGAGPPPDLIVLVEHAVADVTAADPLLAADVAHLSVVIGEAGAIVGPLVVPGRGPCLRCLELHRSDRDPGWPQLLAQLLSGRRDGSEENTCASLTAALACLQVLAHLDEVRTPAAVAATLEVELPDGLISRRDWPAHPSCGCHWPPPPSPIRPDGHDARIRDRAGTQAPGAGRMPL